MSKLDDRVDDLERELADLRTLVDRMYAALKQRHIISENQSSASGARPSAPPLNIPSHVRDCW